MDSMVFSRTLLHCQKKLKDGASPDSGVILGWARQFQVDSRSRLKDAYRCLCWRWNRMFNHSCIGLAELFVWRGMATNGLPQTPP